MPVLTLAHSPDPDDVFMWWPITGMIDPRDHARVVRPPAIETGDLRFTALPADIDVLNRRAVQVGDLDITALSMNAYAHVAARYQLTSMGASMGDGYGPKVVAKLGASTRDLDALRDPGSLIAVPGTRTTAFLLLSMMLGAGSFRYVEMAFDQILPAVAEGRAGVTAGLLIHQSQLTFADLGLVQLADTGAWWRAHTGLPLPLGGNAVRRDLDQRHAPGTTARVVRLLDRSVRYALAHRDESVRYCMGFAPEISREQAERYIEMYVSDLTLDAGAAGEAAITRLLGEGVRLGICPDPGPVRLLRPE